jgi:hypothetical protein
VLKPSSQRLRPGDRVVLKQDFFAANQDGWCLGKSLSEKKVGVVAFVPPLDTSDPNATGGDQRSIMVISEDEDGPFKQEPFFFRSSWIEKADNSSCRKFKLGDRVQLNPVLAQSRDCADVAGKCLGTLGRHCRYGLVRAVGPTRDGVQRNIEVVEVVRGGISIYPAYSLIPASQATLLSFDSESEGFASLVSAGETLLNKAGKSVTNLLAPCAEKDVPSFWSYLWAKCFLEDEPKIKVSDFTNAWSFWYASWTGQWDLAKEEEVLNKALKCDLDDSRDDFEKWVKTVDNPGELKFASERKWLKDFAENGKYQISHTTRRHLWRS